MLYYKKVCSESINTTYSPVFLVFGLPKQIVTSIRVDEELWKQAKIYVIKKGMTLAELLDELIRKELEKGIK